MKKSRLVLAGTVVLICGAIAPAALGSDVSAAHAVGPTVTVQVKSLKQTLLRPTVVRGRTGWITKGGTPRGKCSAASAAGALDAATHGRWTGQYYASVAGIFVSSILGVKPSKPYYWSVFVNGRSSSTGICAIKLHRGQKLLFKLVK